MGSGCFPLDPRHSDIGKALSQALDAVEQALEVGYDDNQFDNAAYDGGALAELTIAANLIHQNLSFWRDPDCGHPDHKHDRRCRSYRHTPGGGLTERRCDLCGKSEATR